MGCKEKWEREQTSMVIIMDRFIIVIAGWKVGSMEDTW